MEGDGLGLDLALLDVDLVAAENDGDVLADADQVTCVVDVRDQDRRRIRVLKTYGASWERSCTLYGR